MARTETVEATPVEQRIDVNLFEGTKNDAKRRLAEIKRTRKANRRQIRELQEENDKLDLEQRTLRSVVSQVDAVLHNGDDDDDYDDDRW